MSVTVQPIKVVGLREAMTELASVDKRLMKDFQNEYKQIVLPMLQQAKYLVPVRAPMSGWNRSWTPRSGNSWKIENRMGLLPWSGSKEANKYIKPYINRHKGRRYTSGNISSSVAFGIKWHSPQGELFDSVGSGVAKTEQGNRMMDVIGQRYGAPSRVMWRAFEQSSDQVQGEMIKLINKVMKSVNKNIRTQRR